MARETKMTGREIIAEYLKKNGFDGLFNADADCGCSLTDPEADFMACGGEGCHECSPGYQHPCDCGDHDYHIKEYSADVDH